MKSRINGIKKKIGKKIDNFFLRLGARSTFFASFYYFIVNKSFRREHLAVIQGKMKHLNEIKSGKGSLFLLTRNVHRIEKGLLMRPRRAVFGKDYILETIESFDLIWNGKSSDSNLQLKWYKDVLAEYFAICAPNDTFIRNQFDKFNTIIQKTRNFEYDKKIVPYYREELSSVSYEEFYLLALQRRSVRWFQNRNVPRELIDKAIMIANLSPSACNRQPYEFFIVDDPELLERVVEFPMGTKGYGHSIKAMVVVVGNLDAYFDERDRHVVYIDASLASMSFMFALETFGLGSCAINWPDIESREKLMENLLRLKKFQRPIMCIGVGYPDKEGMIASSEKKPLNLIRRYNYE